MEKDVLKKEIKDLDKKDKIVVICLIVIFLLIVAIGIVLIIKKNDKDALNRIEKNKNNAIVEKWEGSAVVEFGADENAKYYEYCVALTKDNKDCLWSRTTENTLTIEANGHKYVYYKLIGDNDKVIKEDMKEVFVDNSAPIINDVEQLDEDKLTIRVDAVDNVSDIDKYFYSLDGENYTEGTMTYVFKDLDKTQEYSLYVKVIDKAGNATIGSYKIGSVTGKVYVEPVVEPNPYLEEEPVPEVTPEPTQEIPTE